MGLVFKSVHLPLVMCIPMCYGHIYPSQLLLVMVKHTVATPDPVGFSEDLNPPTQCDGSLEVSSFSL